MAAKHYIKYTAFILFLSLIAPHGASASRADELREKIDLTETNIEKLEREIVEFEKKIAVTQAEAQTLANTVGELDTTRKKLSVDIKVTETRIDNTELNIERLDLEIVDKEEDISKNKATIAEIIRLLREEESNSTIEILLLYDQFSDFWSRVAGLTSLQKRMTVILDDLMENKLSLQDVRKETISYKDDLSSLQGQLVDRKLVADITRNEKQVLLDNTKSDEAAYKELLEEKRRRRQVFEDELTNFEAQLREVLDPESIPSARDGVLSWPLNNVTITQYFGNTSFATQNPSIYNGLGHNGIDLAASIGTPIYSSRPGQIIASGNTDSICPNASYGKWILVEHDNGLSTLYAHLSLISIDSGENIGERDIIGYTGNSGYSTGPHLHFTVFATNAVRVGGLQSRVCSGALYTIPLLSQSGGYLNPLSYLPKP